jgi:hypothetical protein
MDILKNKVIKRTKALSYNNDFKNNNNKALILDSGVSKHYTPYKDILLNYKPINNKLIIIANRIKLLIKGIGNIPVIINNKTLFIKNINYIPNIKIILISLKELINKDWEILFKQDIAVLSYNNNNFIINTIWYLNTYFLNKVFINYKALEPIVYNIVNYSSNIINKNLILNLNNKDDSLLDLYYRRFLYINKDYIIKSTKNLIGILIPKPDLILYNCDNCYYAKFKEIISRKPNNPVNILKFIDCDILGLFKIKD